MFQAVLMYMYTQHHMILYGKKSYLDTPLNYGYPIHVGTVAGTVTNFSQSKKTLNLLA